MFNRTYCCCFAFVVANCCRLLHAALLLLISRSCTAPYHLCFFDHSCNALYNFPSVVVVISFHFLLLHFLLLHNISPWLRYPFMIELRLLCINEIEMKSTSNGIYSSCHCALLHATVLRSQFHVQKSSLFGSCCSCSCTYFEFEIYRYKRLLIGGKFPLWNNLWISFVKLIAA